MGDRDHLINEALGYDNEFPGQRESQKPDFLMLGSFDPLGDFDGCVFDAGDNESSWRASNDKSLMQQHPEYLVQPEFEEGFDGSMDVDSLWQCAAPPATEPVDYVEAVGEMRMNINFPPPPCPEA